MEDKEIVTLYWQRDSRAISETDAKYGALCRSIAYRICQSREDSEECVNDTWFSAWSSMPDKRPEALSPYLGRITRNHALSRVQSHTRIKRGGNEAAICLDELEGCIASGGDVAAEIELKELESAIKRFIAALKPEERRIFLARYWYIMPTAEIAKRLGIGHSKVKTSLFRTRQKLREYLIKEDLL